MLLVFFLFSSRRRHTRYWRDWSSDVCSSDLLRPLAGGRALPHVPGRSLGGGGRGGAAPLLRRHHPGSGPPGAGVPPVRAAPGGGPHPPEAVSFPGRTASRGGGSL